MRIIRAEIGAFGYLSDQSLVLDSPVVALLGPNEAGKSTLFHFFRSMLYGFYPASREQYPYVPWSGATAEGAIHVRLNDGREVQITRRLMSQPDGRITEGDRSQNLRNQTVPFIDHIDQRIFDAIYALTLQEMASIERSAWGEVQDRLLGGMNVDHVLSARVVVPNLEEEAKDLWKDDRRGKPKARLLTEKLRELNAARNAAAENDRELRALDASILEKEREHRQLKERQVELLAQQRKMQRVWPVRQRLESIRSKEAQVGDATELHGLPPDLGVWLEEREKEIQSAQLRIQTLESELEQLQAEVDALTDSDRLVLDHESILDDFLTERGPYRDRLNRLQERQAAVRAAREKLHHEADRILNAWDDEIAARLQELPAPELNERIQRLRDAEQTLRDIDSRQEVLVQSHTKLPAPGPIVAFAAVAFVVGIILWIFGLVEFAVFAGIVAAIAGTKAYDTFKQSRTRQHDHTFEARRATAVADRDARRSSLSELLEGIPVPPGRIEQADASLTADLSGIRLMIGQLDEVERAVAALEEHIAADDARARALADQVNIASEGDFPTVAQSIADALKSARERRDAARNAERRGADVRRDLEERTLTLETLRRAYEDTAQRARTIGEGDLLLGVQTIEDRRQALHDARALRESLEKEYPDWQALEQDALALTDEDWSDEDDVRLDQELRDVQGQIEYIAADISREQEARRHASAKTTVAEIDSEIAWIESELHDVQRQRDRLQLLANIVRQADLRYRERHQPDVLRRAGEYMAAFTDGRYTGLISDESDGSLLVLPPGQLSPTEIEKTPLSQGTRDQIYLALRLAIADHLDEGRVRAPLFLDETFVNWDESRRRNGLSALRSMSEHRQIFVFTCHPWFAEEIRDQAAAEVVDVQRIAV